jgi:hypothetical protein
MARSVGVGSVTGTGATSSTTGAAGAAAGTAGALTGTSSPPPPSRRKAPAPSATTARAPTAATVRRLSVPSGSTPVAPVAPERLLSLIVVS